MNWQYKPNIIQIETVQGCNRRCIFCGTMGMEKAFYFAKKSTIVHTCKLIRNAGLNSRILLAGHGEPTLHPHIVEIVRTIRNILPKNMIHLFTNGTVIEKHDSIVLALFEAGLNDLVFDEYSDHRVGNFVRNSPVCKMFPIVEQKAGVPLFAGKNHKAKRICITPPIDGDGNTMSRKLGNHCGAGMKPTPKPLNKICSVIFRDFQIRQDGSVAICCNDFRGEYYVTNILECKTLREAYFHERLESARKFLMKGNRASIYPCSVCNVLPIRPGLLPDCAGKVKIAPPTTKDVQIVKMKHEPLAKIEKRPWE